MPTPIFRIQVVSRSTPAVNYLHLGGSTEGRGPSENFGFDELVDLAKEFKAGNR